MASYEWYDYSDDCHQWMKFDYEFEEIMITSLIVTFVEDKEQ